MPLLIAIAISLGGAQSSSLIVLPAREISSAAFKLTEPVVNTSEKGTKVFGSVCRRPNHAALSPARIEIDRVNAQRLVNQTFAYLPALSRRIDQPCGHYSASLADPLSPDEAIVVCIASRDRICKPSERSGNLVP